MKKKKGTYFHLHEVNKLIPVCKAILMQFMLYPFLNKVKRSEKSKFAHHFANLPTRVRKTNFLIQCLLFVMFHYKIILPFTI